MSTPSPALSTADPIIARLEDQIAWYDRKSQQNQHAFKRIKVTENHRGGSDSRSSQPPDIPRLALVTAGLGVLITILEGLLHLNQYQQNWITYRSTCEQLNHEKYVFIALAGPYVNVADPRALLAERLESLVSQEHSKWASIQQPDAKEKN